MFLLFYKKAQKRLPVMLIQQMVSETNTPLPSQIRGVCTESLKAASEPNSRATISSHASSHQGQMNSTQT